MIPVAVPGRPATEGGPTTAHLTTVERVRLAAEILVAYMQVRRLLQRRDLPGVVGTLRSAPGRPGRRPPLGDAAVDGARLGAAVVRLLTPLPLDSRCLTRSLVLLRLLARRGGDAALVIAVRPVERVSLDAHAWLEAEGRPLLAPAGADYGRLVTL